MDIIEYPITKILPKIGRTKYRELLIYFKLNNFGNGDIERCIYIIYDEGLENFDLSEHSKNKALSYLDAKKFEKLLFMVVAFLEELRQIFKTLILAVPVREAKLETFYCDWLAICTGAKKAKAVSDLVEKYTQEED